MIPPRKVTDPQALARLADRASNEFETLFYRHDGNRMTKWHHYLALYQRYFAPFRARAGKTGKPVRFLEIGVWRGGSLGLWRRFFGPDAIIFGIDIDEKCRERADGQGEVRIGSQADADFLGRVVDEMGGVDIVLDDASHRGEDQIASFRALYPRLSRVGTYACEDLVSAYHPHYGGGFRAEGSFIEFAKSLQDDMHGWYTEEIVPVAPEADIARTTTGIHVHDGIVFIEKRPKPDRFKVFVGGPKRPAEPAGG